MLDRNRAWRPSTRDKWRHSSIPAAIGRNTLQACALARACAVLIRNWQAPERAQYPDPTPTPRRAGEHGVAAAGLRRNMAGEKPGDLIERCPRQCAKIARLPGLFSSNWTRAGHAPGVRWCFLGRGKRRSAVIWPVCPGERIRTWVTLWGESGLLLGAAPRGGRLAWSDVPISAPEPVPPVFHRLFLRRSCCKRQGARWQRASDNWPGHRCHRRPSG